MRSFLQLTVAAAAVASSAIIGASVASADTGTSTSSRSESPSSAGADSAGARAESASDAHQQSTQSSATHDSASSDDDDAASKESATTKSSSARAAAAEDETDSEVDTTVERHATAQDDTKDKDGARDEDDDAASNERRDDASASEPATPVEVAATTAETVAVARNTAQAAAKPARPATAPVNPLNLWVAAAQSWLRRVQVTYFNQSPTVNPTEPVTDSGTGQLSGNVNGADAEGDALKYTLASGAGQGTVTVNQDGSYTYTPTAAHLQTGGVDSFVIAVADTGKHLHLFNGTGTTSTRISVFVAPQGDSAPTVDATEGFNVYNLSGRNLNYYGKVGDKGSISGAPPIGTLVQPGQFAHFELTFYAFKDNPVTVRFVDYSGGGTPGNYTVSYTPNMFVKGGAAYNRAYTKCSSTAAVTCGPTSLTQSNTVRLFDAPGTVINIDNSNPEEQARILKLLCENKTDAVCTFTAGIQIQDYGNPEQYEDTIRNRTDHIQRFKYTVTKTTTFTNTIDTTIKVGGTIAKLVNIGIDVKWGHTWTDTVTKTFELGPIEIAPHYQAMIFTESPVFENYGDFTLSLGNTTWNITGGKFVRGDDSRPVIWDIYEMPIPADSDPAA